MRDLQEALTYPAAASTSQGTSTNTTNEKQALSDDAATNLSEEDEPHTPVNTDDVTTPTQSPLLQPTSPTKTFFTRLQASLPPNLVTAVQNLPDLKQAQMSLVSTVQANLPEQLKQGPQNIDFAQIRANLTNEFQRVQGITRAQAEEYVQKTDVLLREAYVGAEEFLKEAVKVVPPENPSGAAAAWDGSDLWGMDLTLGMGLTGTGGDGKGKDREVDWASPQEAQKAVATRAQALIHRIKHDPEVLKVNPADDAALKVGYDAWVEKEVQSKPDGIKSSEWTDKIVEALQDDVDGDALNNTMDELGKSAFSVNI